MSLGLPKSNNPCVQIVLDEVLRKVGHMEMFTAWDIICCIRGATGVSVSGTEVRDYVHAIFYDGHMQGYTRSNVMVPGTANKTWVYHPEHFDPGTYEFFAAQFSQKASQSSSGTPSIGTALLTSEGDNIIVPEALVKLVGLKPEQKAYAANGVVCYVLASDQNLFDVVDAEYEVRADGTLALFAAALTAAGVELPGICRIETGMLVIR